MRNVMIAVAGLAISGTAFGQTQWAAAVNGNWETAANWLPADVPNSFAELAVLGHGAAYTVRVGVDTQVGGVTIANPLARLGVGNARWLTVGPQGIANAGEVVVNVDVGINTTTIEVAPGFGIGGPGTLRLNASSGVTSRAVLTTTNNGGDMSVLGEGLTLSGAGAISGRFTSRATITGSTVFPGTVVYRELAQEGPGAIALNGFGCVAGLQDGTIRGGAIRTSNGGLFRVTGTQSRMDGVRNEGRVQVVNASFLTIGVGGLENTGEVTINDGGINTTVVSLLDGVSMTGTGRVVLNATSGIVSRAQLQGPAAGVGTATLGVGLSIEGVGLVSGSLESGAVVIGGATTPGTVVTGSFNQSGGGRFELDGGRFATIDGASVVGGSIDARVGSVVRVTGNTGSLEGVHNRGQMQLVNSSTLTLRPGETVNTGTMVVSDGGINTTVLGLAHGAILNGTGRVFLNASSGITSRAQMNGPSSGLEYSALGAGMRIEGVGQINGNFVSGATVLGGASSPGPVISGRWDQRPGGGISVDGAGRFATIGGAEVIGGVIDARNGATVRITGGAADGVQNQGRMQLVNAATFTIRAGGMSNTGEIIVSDGGINTTVLAIEEGAVVSGTGRLTLNASSGITSRAQINGPISNLEEGTFGPGVQIDGVGQVNGNFESGAIVLGGISPGPVIRGLWDQRGLGGRFEIGAGRTATVDSARVLGGVIATAGNGVVRATGSSTFDGISNSGTVQLVNAATLEVGPGGVLNNGSIIVSDGGINNTVLRVREGAGVTGTGRVTLNASSGITARAQIAVFNGETGLLGAGVRVEGVGALAGSMLLNGTLSPGLPIGAISRNGQMAFASSSVVEIDISTGGQRDMFDGSGSVVLAGTLRVRVLNGYVQPAHTSLAIMSGGSITGRFSSVEVPYVAGRRLGVVYTPSTVSIRAYCGADFNMDDFVDFFDYEGFVVGFEGGGQDADFNGDGFVDFFDYSDFVAAFEAGC